MEKIKIDFRILETSGEKIIKTMECLTKQSFIKEIGMDIEGIFYIIGRTSAIFYK